MAKKRIPRKPALDYLFSLEPDETLPVWEYLNNRFHCRWDPDDMASIIKKMSDDELIEFYEHFDTDYE